MLATFAIGSGIALAGASLYQRVTRRKPLPWLDPLYERWELTTPAVTKAEDGTVELAAPTNAEITRDVLIISLTGATAIIHLTLGTPLFILNGVGYAGLLAAHYLVPQDETYRQYTRGALFGYTGFTVAAYFVLRGAGGLVDTVGIVNKLIELGLLAVLWQDGRLAQEKQGGSSLEVDVLPANMEPVPVKAD